jgi:AmmeMemoRadiSam system protein A
MSFDLSPLDRRILLWEAREAIAAQLANRSPAPCPQGSGSPMLREPCGAFVTLHLPGADGTPALRGCIGRMSATIPLRETIRAMAREAACSDPRFAPLSPHELPRCHIELSVLSPMTRCPDPASVTVGVHGLYLVRGGRAGVLLPQVPVEQGWNRDEYLDYICVKAGLPSGSYKAPDAALYTFTALVFGEAV